MKLKLKRINKLNIVILFVVFVFCIFEININFAQAEVTTSTLYNPYAKVNYKYESGLGKGYVLGVKIAAVSSDPIFVKGTGIKNPDRGTGFDISTYLTNDLRADMLFNAGYQNALTVPQSNTEAILAEKGIEIEGDLLTEMVIFQGRELRWSKPIRGKYILYYED